MGMGIGHKSCYTNPSPAAIAPNPDPSNWTLVDKKIFSNGYVLKVRYNGCTNYEGIKVMVYRGKYKRPTGFLDPHFSGDSDSPVARFQPTAQGWADACEYAKKL